MDGWRDGWTGRRIYRKTDIYSLGDNNFVNNKTIYNNDNNYKMLGLWTDRLVECLAVTKSDH
jgi:hypothetical protein